MPADGDDGAVEITRGNLEVEAHEGLGRGPEAAQRLRGEGDLLLDARSAGKRRAHFVPAPVPHRVGGDEHGQHRERDANEPARRHGARP